MLALLIRHDVPCPILAVLARLPWETRFTTADDVLDHLSPGLTSAKEAADLLAGRG